MKRLNIAFLVMITILATGSMLSAQELCTQVQEQRLLEDRDTLTVPDFRGRPGDTVWMPVVFGNTEIVSGFSVYIEFDPTSLRPVRTPVEVSPGVIDSNFIAFDLRETTEGGRFPVELDNQSNKIELFTAQYYDDRDDAILCLFGSSLTPATIAPGSDILFLIPFVADSNMAHNSSTPLSFFEKQLWNVFIDNFGLPDSTAAGCNSTQLSIDPILGGPTETRFPPVFDGFFTADTAYQEQGEPVINSFTAFPSVITAANASVTFSWDVSNVDYMKLIIDTNSVSTMVDSIPAADSSGGRAILPPQVNGNYSYRLVAYRGFLTDERSRTVSVNIGGSSGGTAPTFTINPAQTTFTTEQGQPVSFTVTAADPDGKQVTLSPTSLPTNATFSPSPAVGVPSATGSFSFTPDFSQLGTFNVGFSAIDADAEASSTTITIIVNEIPYDRLFSTSAENQAPTGGLPGAEAVYFPINLVTQQTVYGVQFDMSYPSSMIRVDSFVTSGRIPEWVVYDNIGDTPGQIRVVTFGLANEPVVTDTTTAVLYAVMTVDSSASPWTSHTIYLENGRESVNPDPNVGSLPLVTDSGIVQVDSLGDVNLDWYIDVADAVSIVGYIIGDFGFSLRQFATADLIINGDINVFDLVGVINSIYGMPVSVNQAPVNPDDPAIIALEYDPMQAGSSGLMSVTSELPEQVAGVQLEIGYNPAAISLGTPRLTADNENFSIRYKDHGNSMTVLLYHMAPIKTDELMQVGLADIVDIPIIAKQELDPEKSGNVRLTQALLSTSSAASVAVSGVDIPIPADFTLSQNYPNPFNPSTNIQFSLGVGPNGETSQRVRLDVFNVLGQRVVNLMDDDMGPGSYEVTWDATNESGGRVATGIYLYRLSVGEESRAKKMLFLK